MCTLNREFTKNMVLIRAYQLRILITQSKYITYREVMQCSIQYYLHGTLELLRVPQDNWVQQFCLARDIDSEWPLERTSHSCLSNFTISHLPFIHAAFWIPAILPSLFSRSPVNNWAPSQHLGHSSVFGIINEFQTLSMFDVSSISLATPTQHSSVLFLSFILQPFSCLAVYLILRCILFTNNLFSWCFL